MRTSRDSGGNQTWIRFLECNGGEGKSVALLEGVFEGKVQGIGPGVEETIVH